MLDLKTSSPQPQPSSLLSSPLHLSQLVTCSPTKGLLTPLSLFMPPISITVTHRRNTYPLSLDPSSTLAALHAQLEHLTSVPPSMQKLLWKGKKAANDDTTLSQAGFKDGMKIQMLGSTAEEVGGIKAVEDERAKRDRIMHERALKPQVKVRHPFPSSTTNPFTFL